MPHTYEIPYHPDAGSRWPVRDEGRVVERFESRFDALRAALELASASNTNANIAVEGVDGLWRPFGNDIKRPVEPIEDRRSIELAKR